MTALAATDAERERLERGLLAALQGADPVAALAAGEKLRELLRSSAHQAILSAVLGLARDGRMASDAAIAERLGPDRLAEVGGVAYVASMAIDEPAEAERAAAYSALREAVALGETLRAAHRLVLAAGTRPRAEVRRAAAELAEVAGVAVLASSTTGAVDESMGVEELIAADLPPRAWLLDGLMQERDTAIVYSWRGVGKTHFLIGLAWALATGGRFLRYAAPQPAGVLHVDGEMPIEDLQARYVAHGRWAGGELLAPLRILPADQTRAGIPSLATPEGQAKVERILDQHPGIRVVLIDNVSTLCQAPGTKENEGESWSAMQEWALRLRRRDVAVIFAHHAGKNREQRGTCRKEDVASTVLELRHPDDYEPSQGARFEVIYHKNRGLWGEKVKPFEARLAETADGGVEWHSDALTTPRDVAAGMYAAGETPETVARALGVSRATAYRWRGDGTATAAATSGKGARYRPAPPRVSSSHA